MVTHFIYCLLFWTGTVHADDINLRENLFARVSAQDALLELAVRVDAKTKIDRSSNLSLMSPSNVKLPIHFVPASDSSKSTLVFVGDCNSNIDTFTKLEEFFLSLGYGSLRLELRGQGELLSQSQSLEPILVSSQAQDLNSVLDQLNLDKHKIAFVGYSYGAAVVLETAALIHNRDHIKVSSINFINPILLSETSDRSTLELFLRLKNISSPQMSHFQTPNDLIRFLQSASDLNDSSESSIEFKESISILSLLSCASINLNELLKSIDSRINIVDGDQDLTTPQLEKKQNYALISTTQLGSFLSLPSIAHRIPEEFSVELSRFLIESDP